MGVLNGDVFWECERRVRCVKGQPIFGGEGLESLGLSLKALGRKA